MSALFHMNVEKRAVVHADWYVSKCGRSGISKPRTWAPRSWRLSTTTPRIGRIVRMPTNDSNPNVATLSPRRTIIRAAARRCAGSRR